MTVLFCTSTFRTVSNGPAKFANLLLRLNGDSMNVIVLSEDVLDIDSQSEYVHEVAVPKIFTWLRIGIMARIYFYRRAISTYLEDNGKPDIIVFNNAILGLGTYGKFDLPIIGFINDPTSAIVSWSKTTSLYRYFRHSIFRLLENWACRKADFIVANSNYLGELLCKEYNLDPTKLRVLYKGVDVDSHSFARAFSGGDKVNVLFVKSDWFRGGLDYLLKALNAISFRGRLYVVGPTENDLRELMTLIKNVRYNVEVLGRRTQSQVFELMTECDIFCVPSREEALGVSNLEAMIHKLPIVYAEVGGIPEIMNYGENGFSSASGDIESLASAIKQCITDPDLRMEKTSKGYEYARLKFSTLSMLEGFKSICLDASVAVSSRI